MTHEFIKTTFSDAVNHVASNISLYTLNPDRDLTRNSKFNASKFISFMVSCGSSSTKLELPDFFGLDSNVPSSSAFNQQRAKLKPDVLETVFTTSTPLSVIKREHLTATSLLRTDPLLLSLAGLPFALLNILCQQTIFSMHLNAFYDLQRHTYSDALIQAC
jgi:transposase DDE domain|nr:hypothetical protein [uncultured Lachnoanaerobaculum sp.]